MRIALAHGHVFRFARGVERYTVALSGALAARGVDTTIVTLQQPPRQEARGPVALRYSELDPRVHVHTLPNPRYFTALTTIPAYLADFLRQGGYDHIILAVGLNGEGIAARMAAALPGSRTRYSIVFHFPYEASPGRFLEFRRFGLLDGAAQRIAVSGYIARSARDHLHTACTVIPEGVDLERFRPDAAARARSRRELGIGPGERVIITVGALEPRKGMDRLVRALAPAPGSAGAALADRLIVVGDGPQAASLRVLAAAQGIDDRVVWVTHSSEVAPLYNAADVFALLSDHEAFGLVALEAMACGLPVVVSDGSAFPEFVAPGTGLLVDPRDGAAIRAALAGLLGDPERRDAMGAAARRHAEGFSWDRVARDLIALLETGTPPPPPPDGRTA